jgi:RNA polymerase sigma factor (sigma-70 family)
MWSRPESDEALVKRLLPSWNADPRDRALAWAEWQERIGEASVLKFIRSNNNTNEPDEDVYQDAMLIAYLEVERGRYEQREGVPFTAYVKGIARNKIREARRRERYRVSLTDLTQIAEKPAGETAPAAATRQIEAALEHRERRSALRRGLEDLPPQRRQVLERILDGVSTNEIAAELRISEELVRQHKCRGLRSLRQMDHLQHLTQ